MKKVWLGRYLLEMILEDHQLRNWNRLLVLAFVGRLAGQLNLVLIVDFHAVVLLGSLGER